MSLDGVDTDGQSVGARCLRPDIEHTSAAEAMQRLTANEPCNMMQDSYVWGDICVFFIWLGIFTKDLKSRAPLAY